MISEEYLEKVRNLDNKHSDFNDKFNGIRSSICDRLF